MEEVLLSAKRWREALCPPGGAKINTSRKFLTGALISLLYVVKIIHTFSSAPSELIHLSITSLATESILLCRNAVQGAIASRIDNWCRRINVFTEETNPGCTGLLLQQLQIEPPADIDAFFKDTVRLWSDSTLLCVDCVRQLTPAACSRERLITGTDIQHFDTFHHLPFF